jgi:TonB family protein
MYDLAKQMADALVKARETNVVVVDFHGVDGDKAMRAHDVSALGQKLADDFRAALLHENATLQVETRTQTMQRLQEKHLVMENLTDIQTVAWFFAQTPLTAWIGGEMSSGLGELKITVAAHPLRKHFETYTFEGSIPLTEELKALIHDPAPEVEFAVLRKQTDVGYPACIYCPQADYPLEAHRQRLGGTVVLEVTIDETGQAKDVRVKLGLPLGLTQAAIDAVGKWRFRPATNAEGKPAAVRQIIEVTFHA